MRRTIGVVAGVVVAVGLGSQAWAARDSPRTPVAQTDVRPVPLDVVVLSEGLVNGSTQHSALSDGFVSYDEVVAASRIATECATQAGMGLGFKVFPLPVRRDPSGTPGQGLEIAPISPNSIERARDLEQEIDRCNAEHLVLVQVEFNGSRLLDSEGTNVVEEMLRVHGQLRDPS